MCLHTPHGSPTSTRSYKTPIKSTYTIFHTLPIKWPTLSSHISKISTHLPLPTLPQSNTPATAHSSNPQISIFPRLTYAPHAKKRTPPPTTHQSTNTKVSKNHSTYKETNTYTKTNKAYTTFSMSLPPKCWQCRPSPARTIKN